MSSCEIDLIETPKSKEDDAVNLLTPNKGFIKANSIDENIKTISSSNKAEVLMDTSENVDKNENSNNNKENNVVITID